jgi:hypothetical protein
MGDMELPLWLAFLPAPITTLLSFGTVAHGQEGGRRGVCPEQSVARLSGADHPAASSRVSGGAGAIAVRVRSG